MGIRLLLTTLAVLAHEPGLGPSAAECQVAGVYSAIVADPGTLALTGLGAVQEVRTLLVPVRLDRGQYRVSLTREGGDLYKSLEGVYFRTRYCYEYVYYQDSVVEITSSGRVASGVIRFGGA